MDEKVNLTVLMTSCCTLKCKLCATYASVSKNPHHYSWEQMLKGVERFFECVGEVNLFTLSGGEPFLHPHISDFILGCRKFTEKAEKLEIITNGTIVPKPEILEVLSKTDKVDVMIDDYGRELSCRVEQLIEAFENYNIKYRRRNYQSEGKDTHCGGWLDISDFTDKKRTEEENEALFHKCMYSNVFGHHYFLIEGAVYMCYVNHKLLSGIYENEDERVEILDGSLSDEEIRNHLLALRSKKYQSVCAYCNGFLNDGKRYSPAEQLN